ncbi:MAG: ATP-binding cassette domain-containing protein [Flavobacteriales bacterium]|nr:ATP-binding cassette domain-containing protein [Flavobacteriales bacterium]
MLQTTGLQFKYDQGPSFHFPDIRCGKGEHLLILGESGRGKTTLLHLLAGLLKPTSGEVNILGQNTSGLSDRNMDQFRGKNIGIIFQTAYFVESLKVIDNLILPNYLTGVKIDRTKAKNALGRLNLESKINNMPANLSIGEQQRVSIARAIINEPAVILADEPTSALDDKNAQEVIALLEEQAALYGSALIIVTHDKRLKDRFTKQISL